MKSIYTQMGSACIKQARNVDNLRMCCWYEVKDTQTYEERLGDIESVERVQRRFTKRLPGLKNMSYDQRLNS